MYGDMPPLVDQPAFIPPPMGASNGGRPGEGSFLAAFPGAGRSGPPSPYWPAQGTPFPSGAAGPAGWPTTPTTPHTYNAASAASWTHAGAQPAPATRGGYVPWVGGQAASGSSPGGSWGPRTPGDTWGVHSPWSAPATMNGGVAGWGTPGSGGGGSGGVAGWGSPGGSTGGGGWGTPAGGGAVAGWGGGGDGGWGTPASAGAGWGPSALGGSVYETAVGQSITAGFFGAGEGHVDAHGFPTHRLGRSHSKKESKRSKSRQRRNSSSHGRARFDLAFDNDDADSFSDWTHVHHHDSAFSAALRRSNSQSAAAAKHRAPRISPHHTPEHVHRSLSWGNHPSHDPFFSPPAQTSGTPWDPYTLSAYQMAGAQASLPAYLQGDVYDENNLAKRPRDWRADYVPRQSLGSGLATFVLGKGRSDVREFSDPVKRTLSSHLHYDPARPPFYWDMTTTPFEASPIHFNNFNRAPNSIDMAQMACQPPTSTMRLFHPRLPWFIDIVARHTNGITVVDIFEQMHRQLHTPILGRHFWNDELGSEERGEITRAFVRRCRGEADKVRRGVVQLDFLGRKVVFEGLARGPKGMWEMRMGKPNEQGA